MKKVAVRDDSNEADTEIKEYNQSGYKCQAIIVGGQEKMILLTPQKFDARRHGSWLDAIYQDEIPGVRVD